MTIKGLLMFIVILCVLLIFSLALNYNLYDKSFLYSNKEKLNPLGLQHYPSEVTAIDHVDGKKILMFYGDSRAFAWPAVDGFPDLHVINRGIGGQTSAEVLMRFPYHVVPYKPDVIVLQVCVNELKLVSLFPQQKSEIIKNCKTNLQQLLNDAHALQSTVILSTVYPIGTIDPVRRLLGFKEKPIIAAIEEVNSFIRTLTTEKTIIFDSAQLLKGEGQKIAAEFSRDWLHLNQQGYAHLNKSLAMVLAGLHQQSK